MSTLIIPLPLTGPDAAALYDYVLSTDGLAVTAHASAPLALLPMAHDEVVALVPAQALSWHQIKLPVGSVPRGMPGERANTRLRSILEGALEDLLLDDPAQLHFALQPQATSDTPVWVAVCDRAWLKAALAALAQAGHAATRIVPEFTPQALAGTLVVTGDADHPMVAGLQRLSAKEGGAAGPELGVGLLVSALTAPALVWLGKGDSQQALPHTLLQVVAEPAVAALAEQVFKRPVVLQQHPERLLLAAQSPWDLAQFDLAHATRDRRWASLTQGARNFSFGTQWRAARWALVAGLLVNLIGLNAWALKEQANLKSKRLAVRAVLTDTFPRGPVVVDAPMQMARELTALQRSSGVAAGADLESILASFQAVVPDGYAPVAIEFAANELRLKGPAVADSSSLVARLKAAGLRASLQADQWLISGGGQP